MKDKKTFGTFIKEKRIAKNYSQKDLAELLFVTESAVSKWERGITYPDITLISDICRVLEISERELIQSSDDSEYRKIKNNSDRFNKIKKTLFWSLNICYLIALLICFIVNLAVNHTLSWFFIVLSSILVAYSFCPTITWVHSKYKKLFFIGSTFISLFILFLVCSIFTSNYWFMIATCGVLLGYFIIFYPIIFKDQKKYLDEDIYNNISRWFLLTYSLGILILILLLQIFICLYNPYNIWLGIIISIGCMLVPIIFGIIKALVNKKGVMKLFTLSLASLFILMFLVGLGRSIYFKLTEEVKDYVVSERYRNINIDAEIDDINIYLSNNAETKISYVESKKFPLETKVIENELFIKRVDNRKFYDNIFNFSSLKLDIYVSESYIDLLNIKSSTGDVIIHEGIIINNANIEISTGDIKLKSNIKNNVNIKTSTGSVNINDSKEIGDLKVETSTGDINITNVKCNSLDINIATGKTRLTNTIVTNDFNMKGSTGDLLLDGFDANNIYVELSTGDVKGTILTSKIFLAKSDTGDVHVPKTLEGGKCIITVSTGDIEIDYK